ncbi:MAG: type II toxin-antitoxin system RatA family toxin [Magnetococcales bacterium]|nr:type II toxin-antitoxin system RatA family toxin [Magnetococcales bacterium]MBF0154352.1 type II toxin-antitoxin system RatA family toxin [Magnetococcales bacterium]MBF0308188.1 type II toxin-antitoxin system RatA family toxin [Magnetococcales bacterium]
MPSIRISEMVPFSPQQMFDLVVDVERYPEFLVWCSKGRKTEVETSQFVAEMSVNFKGVREKFRTLDRLIPGEKVTITLVSGPFEHLESAWHFTAKPNGTQIDFYIDFKFRSRLMEMTLGPFFNQAAKQMVSAFRTRAMALYG